MPATPSCNKGSSTLFAFTPRQVLLSNPAMKHNADNGTLNLKREQRLLLHQSISHYLERSGFSKTLKKFRSEAQIEVGYFTCTRLKDNLEGSSVDLEEMYLKYLEIRSKATKSNINDQKEQDEQSKNKEEGKSKEKKKKKSKLVSESLANSVEDNHLESLTVVTKNKVKDDVTTDAKIINGAETEKKSKHKMKKKNKPNSEGDAIEQIGDPDETVLKKRIPKHQTKKQQMRRKILRKEKDKFLKKMVNSGQVSDDQLQKTSNEQSNGKTNGYHENDKERSSVQKSQKKQHKGSVEQKSAKTAFQRVQAEKVEFADERLQDNSYWAKGGAENGYGAKAEEILGQVRGRDFRHEKTKKKRGTYRGGQIDLHSHSIKFNYSDEE
ncbi:SRP40, C-terminal [Sesbania bispinosa]|nr:SRP40, C-terminal [Sesbania bispinosa]